jgi:hypothetical protein
VPYEKRFSEGAGIRAPRRFNTSLGAFLYGFLLRVFKANSLIIKSVINAYPRKEGGNV